MTAVLGLKLGPQHDTGAALLWEQDGRLMCVALSEERLSRRKQDHSFPRLSIDAVLKHAGIAMHELDLVCADKLGSAFMTDTHMPAECVDTDAWQPEELGFMRSLEGTPFVVTNHHLAHAATAYYPFRLTQDAAVLVVDGSGSDYPRGIESDDRLIMQGTPQEVGNYPLRRYPRRAETQSIFHAKGGRLARVATSTRSGIGHFYSYFSKHVAGFGQLQEGKFMGLAGWGDPSRVDDYPAFPAEVFHGIDTVMLDHLLDTGFGVPPVRTGVTPATDEPYNHIAGWCQYWLERAMMHVAREAVARTGARTLCGAGGVMLNVVANRLVRDTLVAEDLIDSMIVQPASSDAGMPMGSALVGYYDVLGLGLPFQDNTVYLGPDHDDRRAEQLLLNAGGYRPVNLASEVADLLLDNKIVGWWQGRSEYGPRALGHRSILVWPRGQAMKDTLNLRVKHREPFRPFAPICRVQDAEQIFAVPFPVPYMLFNTTVREQYRGLLPAVTHVDGSGRLQTVDRAHNERLFDLLTEVRHRDELGVLLNTSFNDAGEPIVETAEHAIDCMKRTGLDAIVIGDVMLVAA